MTENEKMLAKALNDLLNAPELNTEEVSDETIGAIYQARKAIRAMSIPFNVQDFMVHIKPHNSLRFMDECWAYYRAAREAYIAGESHYEVSSLITKNRNPWVVFYQ